ncbi:MAG: hypothetical protein HKM07_05320 [Chlamydiae bacterium]|nr:hypothetical protein [Chlamydiota bacterium]
MKMTNNFLLLMSLATFNVTSLACGDHPEDEILTTDEKIENVQDKVGDARDRYSYGERQYDRLKKAEDLEDYLDIVEQVKLFD